MNKRSSNQGFTLTELMCVLVIIGILLAILFPIMNGILEGIRLKAATNQLAAWFRSTRYEAVGETLPETLCIRESTSLRVEVAPIQGTDCESVTSWIALTGGVRIDRANSTLRTVSKLAGNGGSIYRVSFADTKGGIGGSYGQLGKLTLTTKTPSNKRSCVGLFYIDGTWEIRENGRCLR